MPCTPSVPSTSSAHAVSGMRGAPSSRRRRAPSGETRAAHNAAARKTICEGTITRLTPSGVLPGVELLANTVRFAPLQVENEGGTSRLSYRLTALLLFVAFACLQWWLRGLAAPALRR